MTLNIKYLQITFIIITFVTGGKLQAMAGRNFIPDQRQSYTKLYWEAHKTMKTNPDLAYQYFSQCDSFFTTINDTGRQISCLLSKADIQSQKGKYSNAFDHLWEAQYLSNKQKNTSMGALTQIELARLYRTFNMDTQVLKHLNKAVKLSKQLLQADSTQSSQLIAAYMNLAVYYRSQGKYAQAMNYLDSCMVSTGYEPSTLELPFWNAEKGYIMLLTGRLKEASTYLFKALHHVNKNASYLPNIYLYIGDYYQEQTLADSAIFYYSKCLNRIKQSKNKQELLAETYAKLAQVYRSLGKIQRAYTYLNQSTIVADSILKVKNQTNRELFEIKNTFLQSISEQQEKLTRQQLLLKKNQQIQTRLKIILFLVLLLAGFTFWVIQTRVKLRKTLLEKQEAELQSKLESEKNRAEIETKSRELTAYALQLIDKDSTIDELLNVLQNEAPDIYRNLYRKYKKGSLDMWNEFNLRFTEVNTQFYERLQKKHPKLSITEQKHCALIKLNLSTKEMARILNIAPHSVHISRSRIRKKMGLARHENLEKYIAKI